MLPAHVGMEAVRGSTALKVFLIFPCLSFLICETGVMVLGPTTQTVVRTQLGNALRAGTAGTVAPRTASLSANVGIPIPHPCSGSGGCPRRGARTDHIGPQRRGSRALCPGGFVNGAGPVPSTASLALRVPEELVFVLHLAPRSRGVWRRGSAEPPGGRA